MFIKKRLCRKCNKDLPLTIENFTPRKTDKEGFSLYCKECKNREKREERLEKRKLSFKGGNLIEEEGRRCTLCKHIFPATIDYFGRHKLNKIGLDTYCKECRRNKNLNNFYKSSDKWKETHTKTRLEKQQRIKDIKENSLGCSKCKEKRIHLLDFHHIDPTKKTFQIGQGESKGWERVLKEIEKCVLLCKNCHADFHYQEKEKNITIEEYLEKAK